MKKRTRRTKGVLGGRSDRVVREVLEAATAELAESGYRAFRMDEVSAKAKVNKTTIYRRWSGKAMLVTATVEWMRSLVHDVPLPDTGSLAQDLIEAFQRRVSFRRRVEGRAWARLLAEKHDPEVIAIIGDAVKERSVSWYAMVTRAITRGDLPKGTNPQLLLGMVSAIVDTWNARTPGRLPSGLLESAVQTIVAGARTGSLLREEDTKQRVGRS